MAKIYSFNDIKMKVSCLDYLSRVGIAVNGAGRCKAAWRGGTHDSVHVEPSKWFDFVDKKGGSVIDLCAVNEFNGDAIQAVNRLGEMFNLEPVRETSARPKKTTAQRWTEQGYKLIANYDYTDEHGKVIYTSVRYEKPKELLAPGERDKKFLQRTPEHECLDGDTPKLIYNLPAVIDAQRVIIVEGEKDVETLRSFGMVGTSNSGGAGNWHPSLNHWLAGKDVVVIADNDEVGQKHADIVSEAMRTVAKSVKRFTISKKHKGDVTDWVNEEGGNRQRLEEIIDATPVLDGKVDPGLAIARQANQTPFMNYTEVGTGKAARKVPITLEELVKECHTRFLGFPKKVGETLFDWSRDRNRVEYFTNKESLFAWMGLLSHHNVVFEGGSQFVSKSEFYEALVQRAVRYASISNVPHYPTRQDVFYTYGQLPAPDITHSTFWKLVSMFNPCNETHRTILAAFLCAPLFYESTADRPLWVIDTEDQQGSGKTSLVKLCSLLYDSEYISIDVGQLDKDIQQVRRRLVSAEARSKRVAVFDNITKTLNSGNLASLITESYITGLAPYGRGEESRPNDITYVVTVNNANLGDDIASRAYTCRLAKAKSPMPTWYHDVSQFIIQNRLQILSDIIHMINNNLLASSTIRRSRFGRFDSRILSAVCRSEQEYIAVDAALRKETDDSNTDADHGVEFIELFRDKMRACTNRDTQIRIINGNATEEEINSVVNPEQAIFIQSADVDWMLDNSDGELQKWKSRQILGLIKNRHVPGFDPTVQRINTKDAVCYDGEILHRYRGFLYRPDPAPGRVMAQVLRRTASTFKVIARIPFIVGEDTTRKTHDVVNWSVKISEREVAVRERTVEMKQDVFVPVDMD